jgi:hypothetical protein
LQLGPNSLQRDRIQAALAHAHCNWPGIELQKAALQESDLSEARKAEKATIERAAAG